MYQPSAFARDDLAFAHDVMRQHSFALLVSQSEAGLVATHLPFVLRPEPAPRGTLVAHMPLINPQFKALRDAEVLVVFSGPHAYVSPVHYALPGVPTWNYVAVHAYGTARTTTDVAAVRVALAELVAQHEQGASAWSMDSLPKGFVDSRLPQLGVIEIPIARIEAKAKLSQNRSETDQLRVAAALLRSSDQNATAVGALMAEQLRS